MTTSSTARAAAPMLLLGLAILSVGHLVVYLCLAGDARHALSALEAEYDVAALESARKPEPPPAAGTAEYSPWVRSYERWHAAGEYTVHARHEGLVRIGMILSFLIGLGLLGQGFLRTAKTPRRRVTDQPARARQHPAHGPARAAPRAPARRPARPAAARPARPAPARRPAAAAPRRLRKTA